ncbi:MAG: hypothetical protein R2708_17000 [Vicinamibacterales bacterium]
MTGWLDPVRAALDARVAPVDVFCRDDDAGWRDDRLARLLELSAGLGLPLDLAVIPAELTDQRAAWLLARRRAHPAPLGLHQHGWAHHNHEPSGRTCEFGPARSVEQLAADVRRGRAVMQRLLGPAVDPIFTPPWNRAVPALAPCLVAAGLTVLSREATAEPWRSPGLSECSPHADWSSRTRGAAGGLEAFAVRCARRLADGATFGLLLHHAVMDDADVARVGELLGLLAGHPMARAVSMLAAAAVSDRAGACGPREATA